jgi:tripeptide aminopeptidase
MSASSTASTPAAAYTRISALAADRAVHRAFSWLHLQEPQIRRWQLEATAIPAPPFAESARADWFLQRFTELRLMNPHIDDEGNVLAEIPSASSDPTVPFVLLSAHIDTVFPAGTDCTPREEDGRLLAPGITDNGAALAAMLALVAALQSAGIQPACPILFAANVGEEGEGDLRGMKHLFTRGPYRGRIAAALALEGAGLSTVISRALGSRRLRIAVTGPGGHSWADFGRPNPIHALATALAALAELPLPMQPRTTLNVGTVNGGTSVNSIPSFATADVDLRSVSGHQLDQIELATLRTLERTVAAANEAAADSEILTLAVERIGDRAAGELSETSPLLTSLQAVDRHLQLATESRIGSTDANFPLSLGIPAMALGAGGTGGGMHTTDEWFDPTNRTLALRRLLLLLLDACQLAADGTFAANRTGN